MLKHVKMFKKSISSDSADTKAALSPPIRDCKNKKKVTFRYPLTTVCTEELPRKYGYGSILQRIKSFFKKTNNSVGNRQAHMINRKKLPIEWKYWCCMGSGQGDQPDKITAEVRDEISSTDKYCSKNYFEKNVVYTWNCLDFESEGSFNEFQGKVDKSTYVRFEKIDNLLKSTDSKESSLTVLPSPEIFHWNSLRCKNDEPESRNFEGSLKGTPGLTTIAEVHNYSYPNVFIDGDAINVSESKAITNSVHPHLLEVPPEDSGADEDSGVNSKPDTYTISEYGTDSTTQYSKTVKMQNEGT